MVLSGMNRFYFSILTLETPCIFHLIHSHCYITVPMSLPQMEFLCSETINLESMVIYDYEKELWTEDEEEFEDDPSVESKHTIILNIEWINKCLCSKFCDASTL